MPSEVLPRLAALILLLAASRVAAQPVAIEIVNLDAPGEGLNDPTPTSRVGGNTGATLGEQRRIAFQYAANLWSRRLTSAVPIRAEVTFDPLPCAPTTTILGYAGALYLYRDDPSFPRKDTWYPVALANRIKGKDLDPTRNDIEAHFNSVLDGNACTFPRKWYYGLDGQAPPGTIDFVTIVNHELTHGLGFNTYVETSSGAKYAGKDDIYMTQMFDATLLKRWPAMTDGERLASMTNAGNLLWDGPFVNSHAGEFSGGVGAGQRIMLYAPKPLEKGSSLAHWDLSLRPHETLEPFYRVPDHVSGISRDALSDMGWGARTADSNAMILSEGRVAVSLTWRNQYSNKTGLGTPVKQMDQYGYFWFDSETNPEVFVKVLDFGGPSYLVFHSALSDLEYDVTFTVLATGRQYVFHRPAGSVCGAADGETVKK
ncbi:MAG: hypothetical protein L6R30_10780 [Thermoanaerobaculia bacterium]|nr:hypothetical protein [Thermoanaerobaculia bacterium]